MKHVILLLLLTIMLMGCSKIPPPEQNGNDVAIVSDSISTNDNKPPVANAGPDQTILVLTNYISARLNASGSHDSSGNQTQYFWRQISGPAITAIPNPGSPESWVGNINTPGVYSFELKVWNSYGTDLDTTDISVLRPSYCGPLRSELPVSMSFLADLPGQVQSPEIISVGNKLIIPGWFSNHSGTISNKIYVYDLNTQNWITTYASQARIDVAAVAVGNKVLFAGGSTVKDDSPMTSVVDIYDVTTNTWTISSLSEARSACKAIVSGNKVYFAGGFKNSYEGSDRVDIYDLNTGSWTTATLPSGGKAIDEAVTHQEKILFCGGVSSYLDMWVGPVKPLPYIDIYNTITGAWSIDSMSEKKYAFSSVNVNGTIFFAGGIVTNGGINGTSFHVEKLDMTTMEKSQTCLEQPKQLAKAVVTKDMILFFAYNPYTGINNNRFDIFNTQTGQWSVGVITDNNFFPANNNSATGIASINDQVYVATGTKLYKMNF